MRHTATKTGPAYPPTVIDPLCNPQCPPQRPPPQVVAEVAASIAAQRPVAVVGTDDGSLTAAVAVVADSAKVPLLAYASTVPEFQDTSGDMVVHLLPSDTQQATDLHLVAAYFMYFLSDAAGLSTNGVSTRPGVVWRVGIITAGELLSQELSATFRTAISADTRFTIAADVRLPSSPIAAGAAAEALRSAFASGTAVPDVMVLFAGHDDATVVVQQAATLGLFTGDTLWLGPDTWMGQDLSYAPKLGSKFGTAAGANVLFGSLGVLPEAGDSPMVQRIMERVATPAGGSALQHPHDAPFAYDAVATLAVALDTMIRQGAETKLRDGAVSIGYLRSVAFEGATGAVSFDRDQQYYNRQGSPREALMAVTAAGEQVQVGYVDNTLDVVRFQGAVLRLARVGAGADTVTWRYVVPENATIGVPLELAGSSCLLCQSVLAAMQVALETINADPSLLPSTRMQAIVRDSSGTAEGAAAAATAMATEHRQVAAIVGDRTSLLVIAVASIANPEGIPVLAFSATSPLLSDRSRFPLFARSVAPDTLQGEFIVDIMRRYSWHRVATISVDEPYSQGLVDVFLANCQQWAIVPVVNVTLSQVTNNTRVSPLPEPVILAYSSTIQTRALPARPTGCGHAAGLWTGAPGGVGCPASGAPSRVAHHLHAHVGGGGRGGAAGGAGGGHDTARLCVGGQRRLDDRNVAEQGRQC